MARAEAWCGSEEASCSGASGLSDRETERVDTVKTMARVQTNKTDQFTAFCKKHRLKPVVSKEDDTVIVLGRLGQVYEYSDDRVAGMFIPPRLLRAWTTRRDALTKFDTATVEQNGDFEGVVSIAYKDPRLSEWVALAQKLLGIRRRRTLSAEQKAAAVARLRKSVVK